MLHSVETCDEYKWIRRTCCGLFKDTKPTTSRKKWGENLKGFNQVNWSPGRDLKSKPLQYSKTARLSG